jgi:putative transposase
MNPCAPPSPAAGQPDFAGETTALAEPSAFRAFLTKLRTKDWVVYAKPPFGGPEQVLAYLGRYIHRIAIANERLLDSDNGSVRLRYRDYAHGNKVKVMRLPAEEFIRRFLLHVSPKVLCGSGTMGSSPIATPAGHETVHVQVLTEILAQLASAKARRRCGSSSDGAAMPSGTPGRQAARIAASGRFSAEIRPRNKR